MSGVFSLSCVFDTELAILVSPWDPSVSPPHSLVLALQHSFVWGLEVRLLLRCGSYPTRHLPAPLAVFTLESSLGDVNVWSG